MPSAVMRSAGLNGIYNIENKHAGLLRAERCASDTAGRELRGHLAVVPRVVGPSDDIQYYPHPAGTVSPAIVKVSFS